MKESSQLLACPSCNELVFATVGTCPYCQAVLGLAAVIEEQTIVRDTETAKELSETLVAPEALVPRLGTYLVERGYVSAADLRRALNLQARAAQRGDAPLVGQVLVSLGCLDQVSLDRAITEQIYQYKSELEFSNRQLNQRVEEKTSELQQALERLSELNQLKTSFIANVSHELRTPLTHLVASIELLKEPDVMAFTQEQKDTLTVMDRATHHLWSLIEDLLQFAEAAKEGLAIYAKPLCLNPEVQRIVMDARSKADQSQVQLRAVLGPNLPEVWADSQKINWVIDQFVDNAIKFTPSHGRVIVQTAVREDSVDVIVTDSGKGIRPERLQDLFVPFHQLDGALNRKYGGMGIGLTLAQRILKSHGSNLSVRSEVGVGSQFSFTLPVV